MAEVALPILEEKSTFLKVGQTEVMVVEEGIYI
jgi:hypothetical protein